MDVMNATKRLFLSVLLAGCLGPSLAFAQSSSLAVEWNKPVTVSRWDIGAIYPIRK